MKRIKKVFVNPGKWVRTFFWLSASSACIGLASHAQENRPSQIAGVEQTKTGAYRALADLSYQAFQRGDYTTAAKIARSLERTWDKGEEDGGENAVYRVDPELFRKIDKALDAFIQPLIEYSTKIPAASNVQTSYETFVNSLRQADNLVVRRNGVEINRMGIYRALAELSYRAFTKGDNEAAAKAGSVLARIWYKDEELGDEKSLNKTNPALFKQIHQAMNNFLGEMFPPAKTVDAVAVETSYNKYLEVLNTGNSSN